MIYLGAKIQIFANIINNEKKKIKQENQRLKCRSRNSILPLNPPIGTKLIKGGTPGKMLFLNAP